jgi:hypothetical protein
MNDLKLTVSFIGIAFPPKVQEKRHKRVKQTEEEGDDKKKKEEGLQPLTGTFGKVDKEQAVQKLLWTTLDDERMVKKKKNSCHLKLVLFSSNSKMSLLVQKTRRVVLLVFSFMTSM